MNPLLDAFGGALLLIASGDRALLQVVLLSLGVSLCAVVLATLVGLPLGAAIGVGRFRGRQVLIVGDSDKTVANLYGMIHPKALDSMTVRTVFIIDPNKKIRLTMTYPASTGRNFDEILRVIDALQLADKYKVATPVNWQYGQDVIIPPSIQDPEVLKRDYPKGFKVIKPYLRVTPQPNK